MMPLLNDKALLIKMGIKKDDKIAIISGNRTEWNFIDIGSLQVGAIIVPLYPNMSEDNYQFIDIRTSEEFYAKKTNVHCSGCSNV